MFQIQDSCKEKVTHYIKMHDKISSESDTNKTSDFNAYSEVHTQRTN